MHLYHNPISSCSQKVRMALHEKQLSYEGILLDLQKGDQFAPEYLKLNPNGVVPTIQDQGQVITESTLINEYLDDAYPERPLKPATPGGRHAMRLFCKKIDDALHPACSAITFAIGARPGMLRLPKEDLERLIQSIPNPSRRAVRRSVIEKGVFAPEVKSAMEVHRAIFDTADGLLSATDWLAGKEFSLADCALIPYVLRVEHLALGKEVESRPNLARWFKAVKSRPAYQAAVQELLPQPAVQAFGEAGEAVAEDLAKAMAG